MFALGIGYADVENAVPCTADSVMKIASISKPITTTILARLWEGRSIDIDAPIGRHVKTWPQKKWGGNEVMQLLVCSWAYPVSPAIRELPSKRQLNSGMPKHRWEGTDTNYNNGML